MSIFTAVARAYEKMEERGWDTIYWAVDLHGVCLKSNYEAGGYEWINEDAPRVLRIISDRPENKIILWSSVYEDEKLHIRQFFDGYGIHVAAFNEGFERDNAVSCFYEKFYFSVLLDDKAGFDPGVDWEEIERFYRIKQVILDERNAAKRCVAGDFA